MFVCQPLPPPPPLRVNARNGHDDFKPLTGCRGGNSTAAYTPAARRRAGSLRSVYVGERWHKYDGGISILSGQDPDCGRKQTSGRWKGASDAR